MDSQVPTFGSASPILTLAPKWGCNIVPLFGVTPNELNPPFFGVRDGPLLSDGLLLVLICY